MKIIVKCLLALILGLSILSVSGCFGGLNNSIDYIGIYYNDNTFAVEIYDNYFKYEYFDGSGTWGDYSTIRISDSEIELVFESTYRVKSGTKTYDVVSGFYNGATVKSENGQVVLYLHYRVGSSTGNLKLVKH